MATTISSLLNSLHAHLQAQTQLLPALHTQLGLQPTALADDLATLQQELTQCVEAQIDARMKQVDEWMKKSEDVEKECIRYGKALGTHVRTEVGSSVGEIRKEQVLPRRFEMISEYLGKLRQLYHTKLDQLYAVTKLLITLSRTLGSDFYSSDLIEPIHAAGESECDPNAPRDVTPERFSKLEKEIVRGKTEITKRLAQLSSTMQEVYWLYIALGISLPSVEAASQSSLGVSATTRPTSSCSNRTSNTSDPFLSSSIMYSTPTPGPRNNSVKPLLIVTPDGRDCQSEMEYIQIFARFVILLEELLDELPPEPESPPESESPPEPEPPTVVLEDVDPSVGLMLWAENRRAELEKIKERRQTHIQAMYDQLESLWRRMGVPATHVHAFVDAQKGSTDNTIRAYEEELDRMLELKRESMSVFVENARAEITKLWDDLMVGDDERADFAPFADDEHTEELLDLHEAEVERLKEERKLKGPLLTSVKKYFDICQDEKELAAAAADQTRLLGRGHRGDPGRLLREEKMRKRVTREKPRVSIKKNPLFVQLVTHEASPQLERDLLISVPKWEAETGHTFLVNGESVYQILILASENTEKENVSRQRSKSKTRSGSVPARSTTPTNPPHHYAPPPRPGTSMTTRSTITTPAVRPRSRSQSARSTSNKRQKLGDTTSSYNNAAPPLPTGGTRVPSSPSKKSASSSLPRPVPIVAPVPRRGKVASHQELGHGRAPSREQHSYHPYPQTQRPGSYSSKSLSSSQVTVYGSAMLAASTKSADAARRASRARRESFKPRPSIDADGWAGGTEIKRRYPGYAGGALTEEQDF
ncbi:hypothetical protein NLI96_g4098 [Meripilus lineatus]|uniref:Uncharacterized protein n=1 Tax=Meripilus lineatus TaxID=2056292 RepID=A0AAD5VAW1_9APHY|nr:hypothetical protein NLI96_g4098 [Physisporinus lineatus]